MFECIEADGWTAFPLSAAAPTGDSGVARNSAPCSRRIKNSCTRREAARFSGSYFAKRFSSVFPPHVDPLPRRVLISAESIGKWPPRVNVALRSMKTANFRRPVRARDRNAARRSQAVVADSESQPRTRLPARQSSCVAVLRGISRIPRTERRSALLSLFLSPFWFSAPSLRLIMEFNYCVDPSIMLASRAAFAKILKAGEIPRHFHSSPNSSYSA